MLLRMNEGLSSVALIDFGLGKKKDDSKIVRSKMGTTIYMAPELLNAKGYSFVITHNSLSNL
jgi:serine/threonine protein kinase